MGTFRLLLALAVLVAHAEGMTRPEPDWLSALVRSIGGFHSVQAFFVISGFYMALVMATTYGSRPRTFLVNRILRLLPAYWLVGGVTLIGYAVLPDTFGFIAPAPVSDCDTVPLAERFLWSVYGLVTGVSLLGQGAPAFAPSSLCAWPIPMLFPVPQSWSLGAEAVFYLLTPWLVGRRTRSLVALVVATMAVRAAMLWVGVPFFPWQQRLVPLELGGFVLGILAYRAHVAGWRRGGWLAAGILWIGAAGWGWVFGRTYAYSPGASLWLLPLVAVLVPPLFTLTGRWRWDRRIGELSYPVFLWHIVVLAVASQGTPLAILVLATLVLAALTVAAEAPVERWRRWNAERRPMAHHATAIVVVVPPDPRHLSAPESA